MNNRNTIFTVTFLIAGYIAFQLIADVTAVKIVSVWGWNLPAGSMIFAFTFTWRDMIHKRLGREWARAAIIAAACANLMMAGWFLIATEMAPAVFWGNQAAFEATLGVVWRIALASIAAEVVSELIDTEVYHYTISRISERHQWGRVLASNAVSLPIDSFIFTVLAFGGAMPVAGLWAIAKGQVVFKAIVTIVSLPLIYTVKEAPLEQGSD